jgi:hypothetical protein
MVSRTVLDEMLASARALGHQDSGTRDRAL